MRAVACAGDVRAISNGEGVPASWIVMSIPRGIVFSGFDLRTVYGQAANDQRMIGPAA